MSRCPKGTKLPRREVPCIDCKIALLRANYFDRARCKACKRKNEYKNRSPEWKKIRDQARLLRVILHACGYGPDEGARFLADLKETSFYLRGKPENQRDTRDLLRLQRDAREARRRGPSPRGASSTNPPPQAR